MTSRKRPRSRSSRRKRSGMVLSRSTVVIILFMAVSAAIAIAAASTCSRPGLPSDASTKRNIDGDLLAVAEPAGIYSRHISYEGFEVSFNPTMHQPNYAAWMLTADRTYGNASRKNANFKVDPDVEGCATLDDYRRSGYDRGHLAPAADMKWSEKAMADCHYLTNITPQDTRLNTGAWSTVEKNCRKWAQKFDTIYIIAGPVLTDRLTRSIGSTPVPVPERFFKVIIAPSASLGIGFMMPNSYVEGGAQATVMSIDQIEAITGYDFFAALPDDIEANLESQHSLARWNH